MHLICVTFVYFYSFGSYVGGVCARCVLLLFAVMRLRLSWV